jgi:hypothetical protein
LGLCADEGHQTVNKLRSGVARLIGTILILAVVFMTMSIVMTVIIISTHLNTHFHVSVSRADGAHPNACARTRAVRLAASLANEF